MLFLLISVCLSVAVSVLLKLARRRQLEVTQMVAVNYPVAALLTWLLAQPSWANADGFWSWWWLFVLLGVLLPLVFVIMGRAVQAAGIVRADAAQRVALVIPLLAAFCCLASGRRGGRRRGLRWCSPRLPLCCSATILRARAMGATPHYGSPECGSAMA